MDHPLARQGRDALPARCVQRTRATWPLIGAIVAAIALAVPAAPRAAAAGTVTIYRCVAPKGQVTLRDTPCRADERQDMRTLARPQDAPPPPAPPAPIAPPAATTRIEVVTRAAPQPLYECVRPDGSRYSSDSDAGDPRWVPLWTLGVPMIAPRNPLGDRVGAPSPHGNHDRPGPPAAGVVAYAYPPGTWVRDRCHALPAAEVCARLRDRLGAIGDARFNAQANERLRLADEERGVRARLAQDCP